MRKSLNLFFILVLAMSMACSESKESANNDLVADMQMEVQVDGMVCAVGCAKYIEKKVAEMDGVKKCEVDFESGLAKVSYVSSSMDDAAIVEAINALNDGQYQAHDAKIEATKSKVEAPRSSNAEKSEASEVRFNFPEIATYFISRLAKR